jgi:hypothetical protein
LPHDLLCPDLVAKNKRNSLAIAGPNGGTMPFRREGQALNPTIRDTGVGKTSVALNESVDAEVARRVEQLVAKTAGTTREQAQAFIFKNDPVPYKKWAKEYA